MKKKNIIIAVCIAVVVGLAGFFVGVNVGHTSQTNPGGTLARGQNASRTGAFTRSTGNLVAGKVLSSDANGITLQITGGGSKVVIVPSSTMVLKSVSGALTDVSVGSNVTIQGTQNTDGSITAQSIQIRPATTSRSQ